VNANPFPSHRPLRRVCRFVLLLGVTLSFLAMSEPPCDKADPTEPDVENPVQIGVRRETRGDTCRYVYTVLNRSQDTLTTIFIGWDGGRDSCELVAGRHAAPDTAFSPSGYECAPWQSKDPNTFSLGWALVDTLAGGIPPDTLVSGFTVALPRPEPIYERLHWMARFRSRLACVGYGGALKPEGDLDVPVSGTGTILGRVVDERGRGVPYPSVFVKRGEARSVSKSDGSYTIADVPAGTVRLVARTAGYGPCEKARVRVAPLGTTRIDFRLASLSASDDAHRASSAETGRSRATSDPKVNSPSPCAPYTTATDRIRRPFPEDGIDTTGAVFLDRRSVVPSRSPGDTSKRRAYFYAYTEREVHFAYQGIDQDTIGRAFTAEVRRNFQNAEEEHLLRIAEETYPPAEAVLAIAEERPGRDAPLKQERLWWYGSFDGVRLPYAITLDAVRYYTELVQTMGKGESGRTGGIRMKRAKFSYIANISPRRSTVSRDGRVFEDVYVVEMRLSWSNYCGSLCACSFSLDRTVLLRRDGTVLCVFGDRKPMVVVS
jgi:Carboxypeptidase regulatory-like domain